jgi:hypothetical protein
MFIVSYAGVMYGPFNTASAAAEWAGSMGWFAPWSIIAVRDPSSASPESKRA